MKALNKIIHINFLSILPKIIYFYAFLSFVTVFLTTLSSVSFAFFLQGFLSLLGLVKVSEINPYIQILLSNDFTYLSLFILAIIIQGFSVFIQTLVNIRFANIFIFEMRKFIFEKIYIRYESPNFSLSKTNNILIETIPQSAQYFTGLIRFVTLLLESIVLGLICLIIMPFEFLISTILLSIIFPISSIFNRKSKRLGKRLVNLGEELNSQLLVSIKNYIFLNILGLLEKEKNKTIKAASDFLKTFNQMTIPHSIGASIALPIALTSVIILFYIFSKNGSNIVNLISFFYILYRFSTSSSLTISSFNSLSIYHPFMMNLSNEITHSANLNRIRNSDKSKDLELKKNYSLEVQNLSFNYNEKNKSIFRNINISLNENKCLLIKGASGSGKSSLLMVLIGVLNGYEGQIKWGNLNIDNLNIEKFRSKIGYLGPEPYFLKGTIYQNLTFGLTEEPNKDEIEKSLKLSKSDQFIKNSDTLKSEINEFGEGLSMGQKQRIGLARALLRKPKILIFDEITANLDKKTEYEIVKNLQKIKNHYTIIVASHSNAFDEFTDITINL